MILDCHLMDKIFLVFFRFLYSLILTLNYSISYYYYWCNYPFKIFQVLGKKFCHCSRYLENIKKRKCFLKNKIIDSSHQLTNLICLFKSQTEKLRRVKKRFGYFLLLLTRFQLCKVMKYIMNILLYMQNTRILK